MMTKGGTSGQIPVLLQSIPILLIMFFSLIFVYNAWSSFAFIMHSSAEPVASVSDVSKPEQSFIMQKVLSANLFKGNDEVQVSSDSEVLSALAHSMKLLGTFAGERDTPSYAIIGQSGQNEKSYSVGDAVSDGVNVKKIYSNEVTITNGTSEAIIYLKEPQ